MPRWPRELTKKQERICRFVDRYWNQHGIAPTFSEIADELGLTDRSHARQSVGLIAKKGFLEMQAGIPRSLKLTDRWRQFLNRRLDEQTNPLVDEVAKDQPDLFARWSADDWAQLRSVRGVGGALTREAVVAEAVKINENRDIRQMFEALLTVGTTREQLKIWIKEKFQEIDAREWRKNRRKG